MRCRVATVFDKLRPNGGWEQGRRAGVWNRILAPHSVRTELVEVRCRVATVFDKLRPNGDREQGWRLEPTPLGTW
jgi:hypothetical protein